MSSELLLLWGVRPHIFQNPLLDFFKRGKRNYENMFKFAFQVLFMSIEIVPPALALRNKREFALTKSAG